MNGPAILVRAMSRPSIVDQWGNRWQYHSRSDAHSKVACWGVCFDLLLSSSLLRDHVAEGKVVMGLNHPMVDFATQREKRLDLVVARPAGPPAARAKTFATLVGQYDIELRPEEFALLEQLPSFPVAPIATPLVALEAKATMTAHTKAAPRLYDELSASHLCVHGSARQAIAIGFVAVNAATRFISPVSNHGVMTPETAVWNEHAQPEDTLKILNKVSALPRRSASSETGFDGLGVVVLDAKNDGSPVRIVTKYPAPESGSAFDYASMIVRMATAYDSTFARI